MHCLLKWTLISWETSKQHFIFSVVRVVIIETFCSCVNCTHLCCRKWWINCCWGEKGGNRTEEWSNSSYGGWQSTQVMPYILIFFCDIVTNLHTLALCMVRGGKENCSLVWVVSDLLQKDRGSAYHLQDIDIVYLCDLFFSPLWNLELVHMLSTFTVKMIGQ